MSLISPLHSKSSTCHHRRKSTNGIISRILHEVLNRIIFQLLICCQGCQCENCVQLALEIVPPPNIQRINQQLSWQNVRWTGIWRKMLHKISKLLEALLDIHRHEYSLIILTVTNITDEEEFEVTVEWCFGIFSNFRWLSIEKNKLITALTPGTNSSATLLRSFRNTPENMVNCKMSQILHHWYKIN